MAFTSTTVTFAAPPSSFFRRASLHRLPHSLLFLPTRLLPSPDPTTSLPWFFHFRQWELGSTVRLPPLCLHRLPLPLHLLHLRRAPPVTAPPPSPSPTTPPQPPSPPLLSSSLFFPCSLSARFHPYSPTSMLMLPLAPSILFSNLDASLPHRRRGVRRPSADPQPWPLLPSTVAPCSLFTSPPPPTFLCPLRSPKTIDPTPPFPSCALSLFFLHGHRSCDCAVPSPLWPLHHRCRPPRREPPPPSSSILTVKSPSFFDESAGWRWAKGKWVVGPVWDVGCELD